MARLIVKSPYIKCGGNQGADGYMRYIATRERVEIIPDDRPPTRKQEQLITKLTKDFPDVKELLEYDDYVQKPTKANASSLITLALEEHWKQVQQTDGYMKYIATRPRAERLGDHGLFGDADRVDLDTAISELEHYTGNVWTYILSPHREDTTRLGCDNAKAWRNLLRVNRNGIAAAMNIQLNHFRWYAAFRDEGKHPHMHMIAWSTQPGEADLTWDGYPQYQIRAHQSDLQTGEAINSTTAKVTEFRRGLSYWAQMTEWYAVEVTDQSTLKAFQDSGVRYVKWNTMNDGRECSACKERDGKIYPIRSIPSKPHPGCRCWYTPAEKK